MAKGPRQVDAPPDAMAQTPPPAGYMQFNTHHMVFELQGTVGELKQAVISLEKTVDRGFDSLQKTAGEHQLALHKIHRIIWMVTGGALVVGSLIGIVSGLGVSKIAAILSGL